MERLLKLITNICGSVKNNHSIIANGYNLKIKDWYYDDIRLTHSTSEYAEKGIHTAHSGLDVVRLHFGMKGDYSVHYKQLDKSFDLLGGHHNMIYSKEFDMEFFNKTLGIETFGVQFPREVFLRFAENASDDLKKFSEKILNGNHVIFSDHWAPINLSIQNVIQQIIGNHYSDGLQPLFLLSKSIELIVLSTEAYLGNTGNRQLVVKKRSDKEKIIAARDIINDQLQSPPNFSQISKMIGLNEYKLKHGFKEIFKTTVFNYLADQRLNLALNFLKDTQKSVAEIAFEMGYTTPQHFNNAFRKKFGFTPNSVRKNP